MDKDNILDEAEILFNKIATAINEYCKTSTLGEKDKLAVCTTMVGYFVSTYTEIVARLNSDLAENFEQFITAMVEEGLESAATPENPE
jgi:hypothetical protein